jgi:hypothetical protein
MHTAFYTSIVGIVLSLVLRIFSALHRDVAAWQMNRRLALARQTLPNADKLFLKHDLPVSLSGLRSTLSLLQKKRLVY